LTVLHPETTSTTASELPHTFHMSGASSGFYRPVVPHASTDAGAGQAAR